MALSLVACGTNHNNDYLQAQQMAPLTLPKQLSSSEVREEYPIPPGAAWHSEKPVSIYPPGSLLAQQALKKTANQKVKTNVALVRIGEDNQGSAALNIHQNYQVVWKKFTAAAKQAAFTIVHSDKQIGLYLVKVDKAVYQFSLLKTEQNSTLITIRQQNGQVLSDSQSNKIMQNFATAFKKALS